MNAKLKSQIDKRREQINENFNATFPSSRQLSTKETADTAEIPMLYLVIMLSLTLLIGVALGGTLFWILENKNSVTVTWIKSWLFSWELTGKGQVKDGLSLPLALWSFAGSNHGVNQEVDGRVESNQCVRKVLNRH